MNLFARGIPRLAVLLLILAALCSIPPEVFARGATVCVWRNLLHVGACPACGTVRALAAFFHGQFARALDYNRNVTMTGPGIIALTAGDALDILRKFLHRRLRP